MFGEGENERSKREKELLFLEKKHNEIKPQHARKKEKHMKIS